MSKKRTCQACGHTGTDFQDDGTGDQVVCPKCNRLLNTQELPPPPKGGGTGQRKNEYIIQVPSLFSQYFENPATTTRGLTAP